jgi:predicted Rossmann fold nucleotide-binding protein DprA/Smf involved in DNA uptake
MARPVRLTERIRGGYSRARIAQFAVMRTDELMTLTPALAHWPRHLNDRLEAAAPAKLWAVGNHEILGRRKLGLFCSVHCPDYIRQAAAGVMHDLRKGEVAVVSGFHSPVEKECLRALLDDGVPAVIGLARGLKDVRIPSAWRRPLQEGRLLAFSPFEDVPHSPTRKSSRQRNQLIAAMSDEVLILHAEPGGNIERLARIIDRWHIPRR